MSIYRTKYDGELKPCPFCGGQAEMMAQGDYCEHDGLYEDQEYYVACSNINCYISPSLDCVFETKEEAAKVWNTRIGFTDENFKERMGQLLKLIIESGVYAKEQINKMIDEAEDPVILSDERSDEQWVLTVYDDSES